MRQLIVGLALVTASCALPPEPFTAPDGRQGFLLTCENGMAACYEDARAACKGRNYEVLAQSERTTYEPANPIAYIPASTGVERTMQIVCAT